MAATAVIALVTVAGVSATLEEARIAAANARRAEQRFEQVRKLANAMVFDVHDAIESLPGATKPRELIVRLGLEYLDQLSRDRTADTSLQLQVAAGYLRLGRALGDPTASNLGDPGGAAASYRKAIGILDQLHARDPQDRQVTLRLTEGLNRLARVIESPSERWALQGRALELRRTDALAHPNDLAAQHSLATSLFNAGLNYEDDRRYPEAVAPFQQALAIFQELDRRGPTSDTARNVALCEKRLAALNLLQGDFQAARLGYTQARAIDERLLAEDPHSTNAKADLAYDLSDLSATFLRLSRPAEAGEVLDKAIALRREAYDADKSDARARRALESILLRQARLLHYTFKKPEAAFQRLQEASHDCGRSATSRSVRSGAVDAVDLAVRAGGCLRPAGRRTRGAGSPNRRFRDSHPVGEGKPTGSKPTGHARWLAQPGDGSGKTMRANLSRRRIPSGRAGAWPRAPRRRGERRGQLAPTMFPQSTSGASAPIAIIAFRNFPRRAAPSSTVRAYRRIVDSGTLVEGSCSAS